MSTKTALLPYRVKQSLILVKKNTPLTKCSSRDLSVSGDVISGLSL